MRRATSLVALMATMGAVSAAKPEFTLEAQDTGTNMRLRGISAVDANVAWASGREGTVLRTLDGGKHWTNVSVPDTKDLDFRDIEAFDGNNAVVLSIGPGEASRVYVTADGGKHWDLTLKNDDKRAFFDCMVFDGQNGWMLGDPVDGHFQIRETGDGGRTWKLWDNGPEALKDEAAFAASGTCIARSPFLAIVSGGAAARAQEFVGNRWRAYDAEMPHRIPAAGVFSAAPIHHGLLLVGGDFEHDTQGSASRLASGMVATALPAPGGYRSGVACVSSYNSCIAVGPSGVDAFSNSWTNVSKVGYDAVDLAGNIGWASGDQGRIARITFSPAPRERPSKPPQAAPPSKP